MIFEIIQSFFIKQPEEIRIEAPKVVEQRMYYEGLNHSQKAWLSALEWCESDGRNVSIIDSNGLPSRSHYQFQDALFGDMSKGLGVNNGSNKASDYSYEVQRDVAAYAVFERGQAKRWSCTKKIGYPPIKKPASV